jgi:glucosyl-3-phosphoglycerate synthase
MESPDIESPLGFSDAPARISVCFPARNEQATIAEAVAPIARLLADGEIAQLVVVDESEDDTAAVAERAGAEVFRQSALMPEFGPVLGKGDAMWRALSVLSGDVIVWLDADCTSVTPDYVRSLTAPIVAQRAQLVKARYRRPLNGDPDGGGRVNHLMARPLLRRFYPELQWLTQPLAGETAMTRALAFRLRFACGFGVEFGHIVDSARLGATLTEVDLGVHIHRHRSLAELEETASEVLAVACGDETTVFRPAMADLLVSSQPR